MVRVSSRQMAWNAVSASNEPTPSRTGVSLWMSDTVQSPLRWSDDASWKLDFDNPDKLSPEEIAARRKQFDVVKAVAKGKREQA